MGDSTRHSSYYRNVEVALHLGGNLKVFLTLPDASVDAIITVEADVADEPRHVLSFRVANKGHVGGVREPAGATVTAARVKERVTAGMPAVDDIAEVRVDVPGIAKLLLGIFNEEGDPESLTVAQLADHLVAADPGTWGGWAGRTDRLAMVGRTLRGRLMAAGLDVSPVRLNVAGRPAAYRLADIRRALS